MPQEFFQLKNIAVPITTVLKQKVIKEPVRLNAQDASIILGILQSRESLIGSTWIEDVMMNGSAEFREI